MCATLEVTIGMADVDAYAFLYYANYMKYNERAASLAAQTPLVLSEVENMTFPLPVHWGSEVTIHTFLCPDNAGPTDGRVRLIHAWTVAAPESSDVQAAEALKPVVYNASVATYTAPSAVASIDPALLALRPPSVDHPLYAPVMACVRENRTRAPAFPLKCARLAPSRRATMRVDPDVIGMGGRLQPAVTMDLFERHRTAIIGGQPSLASLQEESIAVVVCRLRGLRLGPVLPRLGSTLQCVSAEVVSCGGLIFDVLQRIVSVDAGAEDEREDADLSKEPGASADVLAECTVRMVFLKEGKMTPPPPHIEALINMRRRRPTPTSVLAAPSPMPSPVSSPEVSPASPHFVPLGEPRLSLADLADECACDV